MFFKLLILKEKCRALLLFFKFPDFKNNTALIIGRASLICRTFG
nr:MAG TPA: hypothetical protein [Caudoviricetes sp.]